MVKKMRIEMRDNEGKKKKEVDDFEKYKEEEI